MAISKSKLKSKLAKRAIELKTTSETPKFNIKEFCFDKQLEFISSPAKFKTAVCSRRCLAEDTLVQTASGPKPIQDIEPGDIVYDEHGQPAPVLEVFKNGKKPVLSVTHQGKELLKATEDHVFLTQNLGKKQGLEQVALKDFKCRSKIVRSEIVREHGTRAPYAYAIGALLGDGCSTEDGKSYIVLSSGNNNVPDKVANQLNSVAEKMHKNNYSYKIRVKKLPKEYTLWCSKKKAHEKTCSASTLLSWDLESRADFLAGLIDTDGSVINGEDGLQITLSMQAKPVIDAAQMLILDLINYMPSVYIDNRKKYKNGPVYNLSLKHNYFSVKLLKLLDKHLVSSHKKLKPDYLNLDTQYVSDKVGVRLKPAGVCNTYDLRIGTKTNLYTLANGLITHNSGKTVSCAADLVNTVLQHDHGDVLYTTLNRKTAKRIIWKDLLLINKKYNLGAHINNQELTMTFPHGDNPTIHITGAKDSVEIEKFRGMALRKIYIDECQSFRSYISEFIEDVLEPCLVDYDGSLCLIGTPGPIPAGFFYETSHNPEWANFKWTIKDNPHIERKSGKPVEQILKELRVRRGISADDPSYMREYLGLWVQDNDALVYHFNTSENIYAQKPLHEDLDYIFGIDIGFHDADAIAVLGYSSYTGKVYLVEEHVRRRQGVSDLVREIERLRAIYDPVKMVMDTGGLGKKIEEELRTRHTLPVHAAEKIRKFEFIELLNDDLRTGRFQAFKGSIFEQDSYLLQWNKDDPYKLKVSSNFHSDIADAVLYAWRECKHYIEVTIEKRYGKNSDEYMRKMEEEEAEKVQFRKENPDDWFLMEEFSEDVADLKKLLDS